MPLVLRGSETCYKSFGAGDFKLLTATSARDRGDGGILGMEEVEHACV